MADLRMPSTNRVVIAGRMVHTPKIRMTADGKPIASFSIAHNRGYGDKKEAHYFDCTAFGKTAEILRDGINEHEHPAVMVEGRLSYRSWEKDGVKRTAVEIVADRVDVLEWAEKGERPAPPAKTSAEYRAAAGEYDEIPF